MKITQITYSRGATVNGGNFNSVRFDISATVEIEAADDADAKYEAVRDWVGRRLQAEVKVAAQ